jgi:polar amino acid transport system substrate-binding protein
MFAGSVTAAVLTLSACSSSGSSSASTAGSSTAGSSNAAASSAPASSAAPSASSTSIPTQDVVSGVQEDAKLHAELPASVRSSGMLILGTTITPGTSGLPLHPGRVRHGQGLADRQGAQRRGQRADHQR